MEEKTRELYLNQLEKVKTESIIKVILNVGEGKNKSDPVRRVAQYWTLDGQFIGEIKA